VDKPSRLDTAPPAIDIYFLLPANAAALIRAGPDPEALTALDAAFELTVCRAGEADLAVGD